MPTEADDQREVSIYTVRGRAFETAADPSTCMTASVETVDDDRAGSLLGVLAPA
jgi:hypothetical protein